MKFPYLKLTLLMAALFVMPQTMKAEADVEGAAKLLLDHTSVKSGQKTIQQTIETIDAIIAKLDNDEYYAESIEALVEFKNVLIQFDLWRAEVVFDRVQDQLVKMKDELSEDTKAEVDKRIKTLEKASEKQRVLNQIGINLTTTELLLLKGQQAAQAVQSAMGKIF